MLTGVQMRSHGGQIPPRQKILQFAWVFEVKIQKIEMSPPLGNFLTTRGVSPPEVS